MTWPLTLEELGEMREEYARNLGFDSWADFQAEQDRIMVEQMMQQPIARSMIERKALGRVVWKREYLA